MYQLHTLMGNAPSSSLLLAPGQLQHMQSKLHTAGDGQMYGFIHIRARDFCNLKQILFHSCSLSQATPEFQETLIICRSVVLDDP